MAKKKSAGARIRDNGRKLIWVAPSLENHRRIRMAAASVGVSMSRFVEDMALAAAENILNQSPAESAKSSRPSTAP